MDTLYLIILIDYTMTKAPSISLGAINDNKAGMENLNKVYTYSLIFINKI